VPTECRQTIGGANRIGRYNPISNSPVAGSELATSIAAWSAPNEVWTWHITKLLGPREWTYSYLYVLLDPHSRYAVGSMLADRENATLASNLIEETYRKYEVSPETLTLHSDRGAPMTAKRTPQLLANLRVT
jgi:putative transposase